MNIDELSNDQLDILIQIIGNGVRPISAAKRFFPDKPKGFIGVVLDMRNYAYNKITARNPMLLPETRRMYSTICAEIWCELPEYARWLDLEPFLADPHDLFRYVRP